MNRNTDNAVFRNAAIPYKGRGRSALYGDCFNPQQMDNKWRASVETTDNIRTEVYQVHLRHKQFAGPLNVVCILKTHLLTEQKSHVLLFSSDLKLSSLKMIVFTPFVSK